MSLLTITFKVLSEKISNLLEHTVVPSIAMKHWLQLSYSELNSLLRVSSSDLEIKCYWTNLTCNVMWEQYSIQQITDMIIIRKLLGINGGLRQIKKEKPNMQNLYWKAKKKKQKLSQNMNSLLS